MALCEGFRGIDTAHRYQDLEVVGRRVQKVPIHIEALIAWCAERRCRNDMAAHSEYVSYLLSQGQKDAEAPL